MALKSLIALVLALTSACGSPSSQAQSEKTPSLTESLSPVEILRRSDGLRLSIRLDPETVDVGQTPVVVTRFENVGPTDLYVNPHLVTGGFLPDLDEPVRCVTNADYAIRVLTAKDFVRVPPGGAWEQRIAPGDPMAGGPFTRNAPPGTHRVGARYMNYPDCRHIRYDPTRIGIPVWEGRLDAPTVPLTIRPLPSPAENALIARVRTAGASDRDFMLVAAQNSPATNAAVIEYLSRQPENLWRFSRWIRDRGDCRAWTAISPAIGSISHDMLQPLLTDTLLALGARCPTMLDDLRQRLADPGQSPETREQSAVLLGKFRQRKDVPLLIAAMRGGSFPWTDRETRARSGAVQGLADVGGEEARIALVEALRAPRFSKLHHSIVVFLPRIHTQESVPVLISQLSSRNADVVIRAILGLQQLQARSAVPDLVRLLHDRNATVRRYAASTLRVIADGNIQVEMRAAADDPDEGVQVPALWYLALHGDASLAPLFGVRLGSPNQDIREMGRLGLQRVGTSESVANIRPLIDSPNEAVRRNATLVLELITFKTWQPRNGTQELRPADFDTWWEANRHESRRDWAMEALGRPSTASASTWWPPRHEKIRALEFLDAVQDRALAGTFRALTRDPDWIVRIKAAEAFGRFDRQAATRLLAREFDNRVLRACMAANDALRRLTGENLQVDCESPEARAAAIARWLARRPTAPRERRLAARDATPSPVIYVHAIVAGLHVAEWPVYIVRDDPKRLTFTVSVDDWRFASLGTSASPDLEETEIRRRYATRLFQQRLWR
jgi:HEAT repeat protein